MNLIEVNLSSKEEVIELLAFYQQNYKNAPEYLVPKTIADLSGTYFKYEHDGFIYAVTKHVYPSPFLARTSSTVVHKDFRGKGIGSLMNIEIEQMLRDRGIKKITCNIYTDNAVSLNLKLKRGYIVEGTLRDHDEPGLHEYIVSKFL